MGGSGSFSEVTGLDAVLAEAERVSFDPATVIFDAGDEGSTVYVIESGLVGISVAGAGGAQTMLTTMGPGEVFGEGALLADDGRRTARATALDPTTLAAIGADDFHRWRDESIEFERLLVSMLSRQVRRLSQDLAGVHRTEPAPIAAPAPEAPAPGAHRHDVTVQYAPGRHAEIAAEAEATLRPPFTGITIPGLELTARIGQGGFASVYVAHQPKFSRDVAVKVLQVRNLDDGAYRLFLQECRTTGQLAGEPHTITVFDAGHTEQGQPYIAMEYMAGGSMADVLEDDEPVPVATVVEVGVAIAGALDAAHRRGIVHRDVKPNNILRNEYGVAKLSDFGIAMFLDAAAGPAPAMTLAYAAPEQIDGAAPAPSGDVYSLAATMYTLLAGRPPFVDDDDQHIGQIIGRIFAHELPPIDRPDVPPALEEAIRCAMDVDPDARPGAAELASLLR